MSLSTNGFSHAAALFASTSICVGLNAVVRPRTALHFFNFSLPSQSSPEVGILVDNLMRLYGIRNVGLGLLTGVVWRFGDRTTLGWVVLAGSVVPLVDGWVSRAQIGGGEWGHWAFVPVMAGVAAGLLGVFGKH